jgi:uncharacterized protein (TIGR02996 family)
MSDEEGLLAAIWEHPHDDTPRLVYADWLDEHDQHERARFIRLQCEIARLAPDDPRLSELRRREGGLWTAHRKVYREGLPERLRQFPFHRGFVAPPPQALTGHQLANTFWDLLPHAPLWDLSLRAAAPDDLTRLFADERMARLAALRLDGGTGRGLFRPLAESPHARNLVRLRWAYSFAGPDDVEPLCRPGAAPHLAELWLDTAKLGDAGAERLAASPVSPRLRALSLWSNDLGPAGVGALARRGRLAVLEELRLGYDGYGRAGHGDAMVAALTQGDFPRLRRLNLFSLGLTDAAAESLAAWPGAERLRHLELHGDVMIRVGGVRALARSPHLRALETVTLFPWQRQRDEIAGVLTEWLGAAGPMPNFTHGLRGYRPDPV